MIPRWQTWVPEALDENQLNTKSLEGNEYYEEIRMRTRGTNLNWSCDIWWANKSGDRETFFIQSNDIRRVWLAIYPNEPYRLIELKSTSHIAGHNWIP